ncbi:MAG: hypothetical protein AB1553_14785 [Nitrospirota bacterium]
MIADILKYAEADITLKRLLEKAQDYARVYVFAKKRQKGCDGLGEMTNLKDEFRGVLDELMEYCKEKKYTLDSFSPDLDELSDAIIKEQDLL